MKHRVVPLTACAGGVLEVLVIDMDVNSGWSRILHVRNPWKGIAQADFSHYFDKFGPQGVICGDFNAHPQTWEPLKTYNNNIDRAFFELLTSAHFLLTHHLHYILVSVGIYFGSYYFPVLLSSFSRINPQQSNGPRWNFNNFSRSAWDVWDCGSCYLAYRTSRYCNGKLQLL